MRRGMFYKIKDPDMLDLLFQQYGRNTVFRGGAQAMEAMSDYSLDRVTVFLDGYPMQVPPHQVILELVFVDGEGKVAGRVDGKIVQKSAEEVQNFLDDTAEALDASRRGTETL